MSETSENRRVLSVIFGASQFPDLKLDPDEAFLNSATNVKAYFTSDTGLSIAENDVLDLFDTEEKAYEQAERLGNFLRENRSATDLVLFYVGHGGFTAADEYFLALRSTKSTKEHFTGLRIKDLAQTIQTEFPAKRIYLILDCCFAGEAVKVFQDASGISKIVEGQTFKAFPPKGTSLLVASAKDEPAKATGQNNLTMFSEAFLSSVEKGIPSSDERLTLEELHEQIKERILDEHGVAAVRPEIHSPRQKEGDIAKIPLFPNPGYQRPPVKELPNEILTALVYKDPNMRRAAIESLVEFLNGPDEDLSSLAKKKLGELAHTDDSQSVQKAAKSALEEFQSETKETEPQGPFPPIPPKVYGSFGAFDWRDIRWTPVALISLVVVVGIGFGLSYFFPQYRPISLIEIFQAGFPTVPDDRIHGLYARSDLSEKTILQPYMFERVPIREGENASVPYSDSHISEACLLNELNEGERLTWSDLGLRSSCN